MLFQTIAGRVAVVAGKSSIASQLLTLFQKIQLRASFAYAER